MKLGSIAVDVPEEEDREGDLEKDVVQEDNPACIGIKFILLLGSYALLLWTIAMITEASGKV
jgi:hypothetical protein